MDIFANANMSSASDISRKFRAFSDPTRLRLMQALSDGEVCVGDLVEILQAPQPTVSRHLGYLSRAGLVDVRKDGRWAFYSLAAAADEFHQTLLGCLKDCFREVPEVKADRARARELRRTGGCCGKPQAALTRKDMENHAGPCRR